MTGGLDGPDPHAARRGGCLCGAVRYRVAGPLGEGSFCHCSMCRKATGGGFATFVSVGRDAVAWTAGAPTLYRSSPIATRGFCARCGSPLFYDADAEDHLALLVGSLDDPSDVVPIRHDGIESRLPWVDCRPDLPGQETVEHFEGQPGRAPSSFNTTGRRMEPGPRDRGR